MSFNWANKCYHVDLNHFLDSKNRRSLLFKTKRPFVIDELDFTKDGILEELKRRYILKPTESAEILSIKTKKARNIRFLDIMELKDTKSINILFDLMVEHYPFLSVSIGLCHSDG